MPNNLFWIDRALPGRIAIAPRPRGGDWLEDDILAWQRSGVNIVVSLLTDEENLDLGLERESDVCESVGIEFLSFPIVDRGVPADRHAFLALLSRLDLRLREGKSVVAHCRQGIGRSGLVAIALLIRAGERVDEAIKIVAKARGLNVPETQEQLVWIRQFGTSEL